VDYVLGAPLLQMLTMYDYGREKHYNIPVPKSAGKPISELAEMKKKIADAEARARGKNG
jgi:hypothetical protein